MSRHAAEPAAATGRPPGAALLALAAAVVAVAGAFAGSGALGGTPISEAAGGLLGADATPLAPGTGAFRIWSVVYAGLAGYAVLQALPGRASSPRHREARPWAVASMLLNAAWIWVVQAGWVGASLVVIVALLAVLGRLFALLAGRSPADRWEAVLLHGTFGLYLGWTTVAVVANTAAWLAALGAGAWGWPVVGASAAVLALAAGLGVAASAASGGRLAAPAAVVWGLAWIAVGRLDGGLQSPGTAWAAGACAVALAVAAVALRLRRDARLRRDRRPQRGAA